MTGGPSAMYLRASYFVRRALQHHALHNHVLINTVLVIYLIWPHRSIVTSASLTSPRPHSTISRNSTCESLVQRVPISWLRHKVNAWNQASSPRSSTRAVQSHRAAGRVDEALDPPVYDRKPGLWHAIQDGNLIMTRYWRDRGIAIGGHEVQEVFRAQLVSTPEMPREYGWKDVNMNLGEEGQPACTALG